MTPWVLWIQLLKLLPLLSASIYTFKIQFCIFHHYFLCCKCKVLSCVVLVPLVVESVILFIWLTNKENKKRKHMVLIYIYILNLLQQRFQNTLVRDLIGWRGCFFFWWHENYNFAKWWSIISIGAKSDHFSFFQKAEKKVTFLVHEGH